jgi:hypothetical protein
MTAAGIAVLLTQHRWPGPTTRYQAVRLAPVDPPAHTRPGAATGAVSDGASEPESEPPAAEPAAPRSDSIGDWDDLSRGEDPTA